MCVWEGCHLASLTQTYTSVGVSHVHSDSTQRSTAQQSHRGITPRARAAARTPTMNVSDGPRKSTSRNGAATIMNTLPSSSIHR
jgi:hypothetical protein